MRSQNPKVKSVIDNVIELNYGDTITHLEMEAWTGEKNKTRKYYSVVQRANKKLKTLGKMLETVSGVGYRVLLPDEYTDSAVRSYAKGFKCLGEGNETLVHAPTKHMSQEGLQAHREVSDRAHVLYAAMAGGYTEIKMLSQKQHALDPASVARR